MCRSTIANCLQPAMSGDGQYVACWNDIDNELFTSTDYGQTFSRTTLPFESYSLTYGGYNQWITISGEASVCKSVCNLGSFTSNSSCISCAPGTYSNSTGQSGCTICDAGKYSNGNLTSCLSCPAGTFSSSSGQSSQLSCVSCASGKYSPSSGSISCFSCPSYMISPPGKNLTNIFRI